ncbi:Rrf2 family transcriptional regulator [Myxococcus sp. CA051A]|uniref:Rrf2 family transcriptional regulator n=1 Tax=Myxococcus llanfairpwllgwyngyllgogerychwyrndrobwllllantysiliogogogochensis TaxID=2590453 RepID=A0A540X162_9BACT|nr:Rrf2 family transcriptional regulator [Myxococcus llanfairpwllgwyngyllgogerychwyrndrobwllllantysiliogogogochensis]NTX02785.1 Rrf2 family transcriptional regulator [Myxococcus sp. CA040A]NTX11206.1 Rrf2 family transcriptional regulator [Myxococcus sp. CA056]NTX34696.1 Rrf2 family transcriptional regulator [Myxococcus sp. CA033]NTX50325.1 Rrf2 family transcriptional regulator [Myxococcus sp. CA039A]NTX60477.1 Rrf2 family transcriptional regulator [Myxococcus sp. CA051A]
MHLTLHADYSLRVLLYLAARPGRLASTQELADAYGISKHHLVRVVQTLSGEGFVEVKAGRSGGVTLARATKDISVGKVLRAAEPDFELVECFNRETNTCPIAPACGLKGVLAEAREAFLAVLDRYTLADLVGRSRKDLADLFLPVTAP